MGVSDKAAKKLKSHQLINADSGVCEYYTPKFIVEASREVMGTIDLDPASSETANLVVKANHIFTTLDNGLSEKWFGNVWMNHPYSKGEKACLEVESFCTKKICKERGYHIHEDIPSNADWINKLASEYTRGNITQACCITYASTSEAWFRSLHKYPQCYLVPRTNYYLPDGRKKTGVTKGSVVTYLGSNVDKFAEVFSGFGEVKIPYHLFKGE